METAGKESDVERKLVAKITDEGLAELRAMLGQESGIPQYNHVVSRDALAHYASGLGDDNPRWMDPDYAARTRWGMMALPTFVMTCGFPRSRGLPGVHGLFSGIDLHCHLPVKLGATVTAHSGLHELTEHQGRYAGRVYQQTARTRYVDETGACLSTLYSHAFRTERKAGVKANKYAGLERARYTDEDYEKFEAQYRYERAQRRGAVTRYFEDVEIGEPLHDILKGPLSVTDCICFLMGFGTIYVRAHRIWNDFRLRHPGAGTKDPYGVWDVPERVHWEDDMARNIGMPSPYDYGPQRIAWFDHALHDWMGDDGWLSRLKVELRAPNFIGDCTWIKSVVTSKNEAESKIGIEMHAIDQRARVTAKGYAELVLPRR